MTESVRMVTKKQALESELENYTKILEAVRKPQTTLEIFCCTLEMVGIEAQVTITQGPTVQHGEEDAQLYTAFLNYIFNRKTKVEHELEALKKNE